MGLKNLLTSLAREKGIEINDEEFDQLGLADDEEESPDSLISVDLSQPLPGKAAGELEVFIDTALVPLADPIKTEDGLIWEPIARAGQWALRPDGRGGKKRIPLKIVAGRSKDQRREIGLQDVVDAFNDGAIEHVTVPETHANKATENHGYIEALKIVKGKVKDKTVDLLMGGYDIKIPETKKNMQLGAIPSRSAGFLYDYERTDTGKKYPVVLEHVCLTSKPWLRGMPRFGRPLEALSNDVETVSATLSNDGPDEDEFVTILSESEEETFLAEPTIVWAKEDDPQWLQQQVNDLLTKARMAKMQDKQYSPMYVEDSVPCYRCKSAKPGSALITDGYGDNSNYWVAPITVKDGSVELSDYSKWQATQKVFIPDSRDTSSTDSPPMNMPSMDMSDNEVEISSLELAQASRSSRGSGKRLDLSVLKAKKRNKLPDSSFAIPEMRMFPIHDENHARNALARASGTKYESRVREAVKKRWPNINMMDKQNNDDSPRGGGNMGNENKTLQLSDEARALIQAAEDRAAAAEERATQLSQTVDKLVGTHNAREADTFIEWMKSPADKGGLGLDEAHGFGGMLTEIHQVLLADDGGVALQSEHFSDDKNTTGELTISDAMKRVFSALRTADGSTIKLADVVTPPTELDEEGNPKGKPSKDDPDSEDDLTNLSDEEILSKDDPKILAKLGIKLPSNGKGEE